MNIIAYNHEQLFYDARTLDANTRHQFIIREVSEAVFRTLQRLPSKAFARGNSIKDLVEQLIQEETKKEEN
jgi:hypothetical protein